MTANVWYEEGGGQGLGLDTDTCHELQRFLVEAISGRDHELAGGTSTVRGVWIPNVQTYTIN